MNHHNTIDDARGHFDFGNRAASDGRFGDAAKAFRQAANTASVVWRDAEASQEVRSLAARLSADSTYSAGMSAVRLGDPGEHMQAAILIGVEIYELESLEDDVRLHGLYRAQCCAFELAHAVSPEDTLQAEEYFIDAVGCAQALPNLGEVDAQKVVRVLANAAAASYALAQLRRAREARGFKTDLEKALELGQAALDMPELRGMMQAETYLVLADASYDLAMTVEDPSKAADHLRNALGYTRESSEAPGADGVLQGQAMLRGANYACAYGLYLRNEDFEGGVEALEGAIGLALAVADQDHLPMDLRAPAWETAIRTGQNIGLLFKERDMATARNAFEASAGLAQRAASTQGLPAESRALCLYLGANASLEQAILMQALAGDEKLPDALALLRKARDLARTAMDSPGCIGDIAARSCLLTCGVSGRFLRTLNDPADAAAITTELEKIEVFGQRAAETKGAMDEHRATGASFAADAATQLATRTKDPRKAAELKHRADALRKLQKVLQPEEHSHHHH